MNMVVLRRPVIRGVNYAGTVSAFLKTVEVFRPSPFRNEILDRKGSVWLGKTCKLYRTGDRWELREK